MALIQCPECGRNVSDQAQSCPNCGYPISRAVVASGSGEEEDTNCYVKCPSCANVTYYEINSEEDACQYGSMRDVSTVCDNCGTEIEVSFFHYCPECEHFVGYRPASWGRVASSFAGNFLSGFLNPLETAGALIDRVTDDYPSASAAGTCHFCNNDTLLCPNCNSTFFIEVDDGFDTKYQCPHCGQVMYQP